MMKQSFHWCHRPVRRSVSPPFHEVAEVEDFALVETAIGDVTSGRHVARCGMPEAKAERLIGIEPRPSADIRVLEGGATSSKGFAIGSAPRSVCMFSSHLGSLQRGTSVPHLLKEKPE